MQERTVLDGKPTIIALTITPNAQQVRNDAWDTWYVPKQTLVMQFMLTLQQRRFVVAKGLPEAEVLFKEGQNFQWKVTETASGDPYMQWRNTQHDDLLLACAVAVWYGERTAPRGTGLGFGEGLKAIPPGNPLERLVSRRP
jgi:hypothetical protein